MPSKGKEEIVEKKDHHYTQTPQVSYIDDEKNKKDNKLFTSQDNKNVITEIEIDNDNLENDFKIKSK